MLFLNPFNFQKSTTTSLGKATFPCDILFRSYYENNSSNRDDDDNKLKKRGTNGEQNNNISKL